jgi:hypothetical protein
VAESRIANSGDWSRTDSPKQYPGVFESVDDSTGELSEVDDQTISVLIVALDQSRNNLRAQFTVPLDGLDRNQWLDGNARLADTPCAPGSKE